MMQDDHPIGLNASPASLPEPAERLPAPAPEAMPGPTQAVWAVLDRLEQALDRETAQLTSLRSAEFNRLNEIKSRLLLDASRAMRALRVDAADGRLLARLSTLRLKLEHNRMAIGMHLDAVREIAAAMTAALIEAESDGTYSATARVAPPALPSRAP